MTTHSPSTVALAPDGTVFQMERGARTVTQVQDRAAAIADLTAGLVTVSLATKFCFVEDEDDVLFYNAILDILTDTGPSRDTCSIKQAPSIVFIPASVGKGREKISGGNSIVSKWVSKLDAEPLVGTFFGVVDGDDGSTNSDRIKVIGRYSFENYLLDPLTVFGLLLENGTPPSPLGVTISQGDEHLIRLMQSTDLQIITDAIVSGVESVNSSVRSTSMSCITYTNGARVDVPSWVITYRGHDLLPAFQRAFGGPQVVTPPRLLRALRRVRMIPLELAELYANLQG